MPVALLVLRIWLAFVCFFNLVIVSTYYGLRGGLARKGADYGILISSILLFISYLYSIWGKNPITNNKYVRALLMLILAVVLIGCSSYLVHLQIVLAETYSQYLQGNQSNTLNPFTCDSYEEGWEGIGNCFLDQSYNFGTIITGIFVIIEVLVTFFRGPLHPLKA